jgi:chloramphenicol 3-O phosphotransferase
VVRVDTIVVTPVWLVDPKATLGLSSLTCMDRSVARVVVLNGPGSVGKGAIAAELQRVLPEVYLHLSMDGFLAMLPADTEGSPEGLQFEAHQENGHPTVRAFCGPAGLRALAGMREAAGAMTAAGNSLIIDEVAEGPEIDDYRRILEPYQPLFVGLTAPLAVLEERERTRGDRMIGLARWQYRRVHQGIRYDSWFDTSQSSPLEIAVAIAKELAASTRL